MAYLEPKLPMELEKQIFEIAAYALPTSIPALMLTAWRVKIWVEPIFFRVVLLASFPSTIRETGRHGLGGRNTYPLPNDITFSRISSTPPAVLRHSVQHLYLDLVPNSVADFLLSSCENVQDLWLFLNDHTTALDLVGSLPLRRLHCRLEDLFQSPQPDFNHPMFAQLTHLEVFPGVAPTQSVWAGLALIPNLTHLAFTEVDFLELVPELLRTCTSLRVVVLLMDGVSVPPELEENQIDERLVCMPCSDYTKDWHMGALMGLDYWVRAEEFISRRQAGVVERTQFVIQEDASPSLQMPGEF